MFSGSHSGPCMYSAAPGIDAVICVSARGQTTFAVTPYLRSSLASTSVIDTMPALAVE